MHFSVIGFETLVRRELKRTFSIINQVIWPPLISTFLYLLIFGLSLGRQIATVEGVPYLKFLIPGLVLMAVIDSSFNESAASLFVGRFTNSVQELLVAPLSYFEIVLGFIFGGVLRGLIIGNLLMLLGWLMAGVTPIHWGWYFGFMVLTAAFFSALGIMMALFAETFDQLAIPPTFIITPLVFLGGVFSSIKLLPPLLQRITKLDPLYYLIDGFRASMLTGWESPILWNFALLSGFTVLAIAGALILFRSGYKLRS